MAAAFGSPPTPPLPHLPHLFCDEGNDENGDNLLPAHPGTFTPTPPYPRPQSTEPPARAQRVDPTEGSGGPLLPSAFHR